MQRRLAERQVRADSMSVSHASTSNANGPGDSARRHAGSRLMASLITIWWRDIPMQVIARKDGARAHKRVLHKRFQVAVDKAAMKAGKKSYGDYIEEMRRERARVWRRPRGRGQRRGRRAWRPPIHEGSVLRPRCVASGRPRCRDRARPDVTDPHDARRRDPHRRQLARPARSSSASTGHSRSSASASTRPVGSSSPRR